MAILDTGCRFTSSTSSSLLALGWNFRAGLRCLHLGEANISPRVQSRAQSLDGAVDWHAVRFRRRPDRIKPGLCQAMASQPGAMIPPLLWPTPADSGPGSRLQKRQITPGTVPVGTMTESGSDRLGEPGPSYGGMRFWRLDAEQRLHLIRRILHAPAGLDATPERRPLAWGSAGAWNRHYAEGDFRTCQIDTLP